MGFKRLSIKENDVKSISSKSEESFMNGARGETSLPKTTLGKRNIQMQFYFNDDEVAILKANAADLGMKVTQYVRFMLFNADKIRQKSL